MSNLELGLNFEFPNQILTIYVDSSILLKQKDCKKVFFTKSPATGSIAGHKCFDLKAILDLFGLVDFLPFGGVAELGQGPKFKLADPLFGNPEFFTNLFKRAWLGTLT